MKRIAVLHINLKELPPNFRPRKDVVRLQVPIWSAGTRVELPIDFAVEIKSKSKVSLEGDEQRELLKRLANRGEGEDETSADEVTGLGSSHGEQELGGQLDVLGLGELEQGGLVHVGLQGEHQ